MLKPLHEFFVIETIVEKESASGLIMTNAKAKSKAKVLAIPKSEDEVQVGDFIVIDKGMPYTILIDGEEYTVISKEDVFGIL